MSFMIVNTGRAASRAFSINLYDQPAVTAFPRYDFDQVAKAFIAKKNPKPLARLGQRMSALNEVTGHRANLGIVFHGMRPKLAHPFDSDINVRFLKAVRSQLGIESVFLVIRDPETLMLSELNREAARPEGNWSFEAGRRSWHDSYSLSDMKRIGARQPTAEAQQRHPVGIDVEAASRKLAERTGDFHTVWTLFSKVFEQIYIVPYTSFLTDPNATMEAIGKKAGVPMIPSPLAQAKLNSLSNRLMIYNPVVLSMQEFSSSPGKGAMPTGLFKRQPARSVRFRFELRDVIRYCSDWGQYVPANVEGAGTFEKIEKDVGHPIGLGLHLEDLQHIDQDFRSLITQQAFLEEFMETFSGIFNANYEFYRDFYKSSVNYDELPETARSIFLEKNRKSIDAFNEMLARGDVRSVFDD